MLPGHVDGLELLDDLACLNRWRSASDQGDREDGRTRYRRNPCGLLNSGNTNATKNDSIMGAIFFCGIAKDQMTFSTVLAAARTLLLVESARLASIRNAPSFCRGVVSAGYLYGGVSTTTEWRHGLKKRTCSRRLG